jgi:RluA family pseudouridine synthase
MEILYDDENFIVVNKPPLLASVPGGWADASAGENLVEQLTSAYGRIWIVHRLDRGTSGVILFARNAVSHRALSISFESHQVHKEYHALVCNVPNWEEHVARHLLRQDVGHAHRTVVDHLRGKSAVTRFRVLERFSSHSLLKAVPETGRTHQVRAHASALGFPLLGDKLYGAPQTDLIGRPALHAWSLSFTFEGKSFSYTAPYPPDFSLALETLRTPGGN